MVVIVATIDSILAENYFCGSEDSRHIRCQHERLGCVQVVLVGGEVLLLFQLLFQICVTTYEYTLCACLYCTIMCVAVCVCVHVWIQGLLIVDRNTFKKKRKKKSQHRPLLCHQFKGLFSTEKKALGKKRDGQKKETDFKMCSKEKQTQGSLLFSLLFGFFLCSYRKEQNDCGVQLQVKGVETGYWIDLNTFTDFHGGHLTFEKGGWGLR